MQSLRKDLNKNPTFFSLGDLPLVSQSSAFSAVPKAPSPPLPVDSRSVDQHHWLLAIGLTTAHGAHCRLKYLPAWQVRVRISSPRKAVSRSTETAMSGAEGIDADKWFRGT